jgi:hypothetical protein
MSCRGRKHDASRMVRGEVTHAERMDCGAKGCECRVQGGLRARVTHNPSFPRPTTHVEELAKERADLAEEAAEAGVCAAAKVGIERGDREGG